MDRSDRFTSSQVTRQYPFATTIPSLRTLLASQSERITVDPFAGLAATTALSTAPGSTTNNTNGSIADSTSFTATREFPNSVEPLDFSQYPCFSPALFRAAATAAGVAAPSGVHWPTTPTATASTMTSPQQQEFRHMSTPPFAAAPLSLSSSTMARRLHGVETPPVGVTLNRPRPTRSSTLAARTAIPHWALAEPRFQTTLQEQQSTPPAAEEPAVLPIRTSRPRRTRRCPPTSNSDEEPPTKKPRVSLKKPPPSQTADDEDQKRPAEDAEPISCCICMCEPDREEVSKVDGCDHKFCFSCIGKWSDRENSCPLCKSRFTKISRMHPQKRKKGGPSVTNVKMVKQRDQRADIVPGAALEGLLASIAANGGVPGGTRLGRFIFARMSSGNSVLPIYGGSRGSTRVTFSVEDSLFDSDEEEDEFVPNFMNVIMRSTLQSHMARQRAAAGAFTASRMMPSVAPLATAASPRGLRPSSSSQSPFGLAGAATANDSTAGNAAENPLTIDDDSDDDVEIIQVTRSA